MEWICAGVLIPRGRSNFESSPSTGACRPSTPALPWPSPRSLDVMEAADKLKEYTRAVNDGDLSHAESMLINQAHTLKAMFD